MGGSYHSHCMPLETNVSSGSNFLTLWQIKLSNVAEEVMELLYNPEFMSIAADDLHSTLIVKVCTLHGEFS